MLKVKRERWITQIKDLNRRMVHFFEQNKVKEFADDNWLFYIACNYKNTSNLYVTKKTNSWLLLVMMVEGEMDEISCKSHIKQQR